MSEALERLQKALDNNQKPYKWLDANIEDVKAALLERPARVLAELLGFPPTTFFAWMARRGLRSPGIGEKRTLEGLKRPGGPATRKSAEYWRGRAEALEELLHHYMDLLHYYMEKETPK